MSNFTNFITIGPQGNCYHVIEALSDTEWLCKNLFHNQHEVLTVSEIANHEQIFHGNELVTGLTPIELEKVYVINVSGHLKVGVTDIRFDIRHLLANEDPRVQELIKYNHAIYSLVDVQDRDEVEHESMDDASWFVQLNEEQCEELDV